jgi:hypothetical protein
MVHTRSLRWLWLIFFFETFRESKENDKHLYVTVKIMTSWCIPKYLWHKIFRSIALLKRCLFPRTQGNQFMLVFLFPVTASEKSIFFSFWCMHFLKVSPWKSNYFRYVYHNTILHLNRFDDHIAPCCDCAMQTNGQHYN